MKIQEIPTTILDIQYFLKTVCSYVFNRIFVYLTCLIDQNFIYMYSIK